MKRFLLVACFLLSLVVVGCSRPQVATDHRPLIKALRTAVNTHKTDWLEKQAKEIESLHDAGKMSDDEYAAFASIIADARAGHWEAAETEVIKLARAQVPNADDLARAQPGSGHPHRHHSHAHHGHKH